MILVDTSVWVDHLRAGDKTLTTALGERRVLTHPFVVGEIALGNLRQRDLVLALLRRLPVAQVATNDEALSFIDAHNLGGTGSGLIDAHLLASAQLTPGARLWTRDRVANESCSRSCELIAPATPARGNSAAALAGNRRACRSRSIPARTSRRWPARLRPASSASSDLRRAWPWRAWRCAAGRD